MTPLQRAVAVAGNEAHRIDGGARHGLDDELRGDQREVASPPLLPGTHERAGAIVVDERSPRGGEAESAPRALRTATQRPGARGATPLADRWRHAYERAAARGAQGRAGKATDGAPLWQEHGKDIHGAKVRPGR